MNTNNIDKVLGQRVDSPTTYTPEILVREERQRNRTYLGLQDESLPFVGFDIWNGYECSALTESGLPVTCVAKVVYSCSNKYIVESKSMKLYWNGFNMQPMGKNVKEVLKNIKTTAEKDLSALLETEVKVELYSQLLENRDEAQNNWAGSYTPSNPWEVLENIPAAKKMKFTVFNETPDLLKVEDNIGAKHYMSSLLRSNCKITHQPDSGDIYIYYSGNKSVTEESLLEWVVSFRNECHFHEEICEAAYKRLWDALQPKELLVTCFYARRGGWDIVPTRASNKKLLDKNLINPKSYYFKFPRQ
ncbi:MAG: NADPH-dependent 7-cyano-7-deazaguanine reductase QueF [Cytophagia bacterium]|jgi:7-cyano-7-deazaguanine reductase|nr:NADPH-dependent 7-cyano-7-deazaguanine reductase QueF [Cytophagia bacterium]NBW33534.1 NADPH-dependent 7-cyano-7-deazaguanine reductase QueF [Cytophagia bacterium]